MYGTIRILRVVAKPARVVGTSICWAGAGTHRVIRVRAWAQFCCKMWGSSLVGNQYSHWAKAQPGGELKGLSPPLSDQNIDVYFLSFSPSLYCKSRSGALQNVLWQYHKRSNTFSIKPSGYEFSRFEKYWSSFLLPACFALPYITRAGFFRALPVWKQAWHLNCQQCRLMCSFYVTKLGPS